MMQHIPQRLLMPTILECTNGSGIVSESQSHGSGTQRSELQMARETENRNLKTDTLMYTISNTKDSSYRPSDPAIEVSQKPLRELQNRINKCVIQDDNTRSFPSQKQTAGYNQIISSQRSLFHLQPSVQYPESTTKQIF